MKRNLIKKLTEWKAGTGRKPLILKGVRQTGKTYLLKQFGKAHFPRYHYINLEKQENLHALFQGDLDPNRIINDLRFVLKTSININEDLLIIDEIQACPNALTSLKYFCEDMPELAVCSAGSLLGLHLNSGSYPVGKVDMLHLHPLTFSEFLAGIGEEQLAHYFLQINSESSISETVHQRLWERLKHYFITGGLPEIVTTFTEHQDNLYDAVNATRNKQEELIKAYYADIAKHAGKVNAMHIDRTWRSIPAQLSHYQDTGTNRFKFKDIIPGINRYKQLVNVIDWLASAELIIKLPIIHHVEIPLSAYTQENTFKLMIFDIGILGAISGLDPESILNYQYGTYKGYFAENFVAQQLLTTHQQLYSWHEDRSEVEFLLQTKGRIIPIEVKSGKITRAKSLQKYINKYKPEESILLSGNNVITKSKENLLKLPLYLAERVTIMD